MLKIITKKRADTFKRVRYNFKQVLCLKFHYYLFCFEPLLSLGKGSTPFTWLCSLQSNASNMFPVWKLKASIEYDMGILSDSQSIYI